jgi:hypothetical protein
MKPTRLKKWQRDGQDRLCIRVFNEYMQARNLATFRTWIVHELATIVALNQHDGHLVRQARALSRVIVQQHLAA